MPAADVVAVLDAVAHEALRRLPAAVAVSVTLVNASGARTAAASSQWADDLNQAQYAAGSGPGVDAAISGEACVMNDAVSETRWPAYVRAALACGAQSSVSVPIPIDDNGVVGSLNAFALGRYEFSEIEQAVLRPLAGTAAAALLTQDVDSFAGRWRAVIEQARGILMFREGCSATEALGHLRRSADATGRSMHEVAGALVREASRT